MVRLERWKPIRGYEHCYAVSDKGNVKSLRRDKVLKQHINKQNGYCYVVFSLEGNRKTMRVHRLVAMEFCPNPHNYLLVNHKDENKTNNRADNLEWCTAKYNSNYGHAKIKKMRSRIQNGNTRKIVAVNIHTREKKEYLTRHECARDLGVTHQSIRQFLNGKGVHRVGNYIFIDQANYSEELENKLVQRALHPKNKCRKVTVFVGQSKKHFNSISASSKFIGASAGHVFTALKKNERVKGYKVAKGWV